MSHAGEDAHSERSGHRRHHRNRSRYDFSSGYRPDRRNGGASRGHHSSSGDEALLNRNDVVQVEILPQEDNWGENTTCVTGNTSERSYSCEDVRLPNFKSSVFDGGITVRMRCARYIWLGLAGLISLTAFLSPVVMVVLPKTLGRLITTGPAWNTTECKPDCEGLLISFGFKLLILLLGVWALFFRRALADLPRLFLARACVLALVFMVTFAYWLFYGVRIWDTRQPDYTAIVTFSLSLVDALLFIHYLAVVLLELRHIRPEYKIRVVRSPDGESRTYSIGQLSIQRAAVVILQNYYQDFPVYNPYLDRLPGGSNRMRLKGNGSQANGPAGFKLYNLEGGSGGETLPEANTQALLMAAAKKRDSGHNERFYEEIDWKRRVKKRKARLVTAAEEAFAHVKRLHEEKGPCVPMDSQEAAQAVFPSLARSLQKYLRVTRQQPRHSAEQVVRHLSQYLSFDMSPRSFLERFFNTQETFEASQLQTKWSVVCEQLVSGSLGHGVIFQLRCHCAGPDAGVQLLCTVTRLPFFNLTEEVFDAKNNKFVLRLNSETSV